jgi:peptidoglycan/LPS O-acetylase OafA/YrhL
LNYRPDIDGLRAIAVLSVVFYHAGLGFPGGYVGVDVFFVISGYLITALILKDLERGSFSMANFWERRIRRIFPALAVMVAVTCVAGWFLLLPDDLAKLGASVIAQSLLVSNFYFWRTTNYFGGANEEKPLLHTWSLAVEEQFYLIFPIALMAIWAFFNYRLKKREERNLTTECTTEHLGRGEEEQTKFGPKGEGMGTTESKSTGEAQGNAQGTCAGAAFSNPSTSELARDSENTSLNRSAIGPASLQATSNPLRATESLCDATPSTLDPRPSTHLGYQRRWALFWIFAAVALLSFGISIWGVKAQPFATFFILPTRAWELLLGSMLAVLPAAMLLRHDALRDLLSLAGLAGIFLPVFFYGEQTPFPGLTALPPCLGAAVLIWANTTPANCVPNQSKFASALSWPPIVFIGLISYSLYLWHWPVICFSSYWAVSEFTAMEKWGIILASVLFASVSWKFLETPFRKRGNSLLIRKPMFAFVSLSLLLGIVGFFFDAENGAPSRLPEQARQILDAANKRQQRRIENRTHSGNSINDLIADSLPRLNPESSNSPQFLVWGDSHAKVAEHAFKEIAIEKGIQGVSAVFYSTPPVFGWKKNTKFGAANPDEVAKHVAEYIVQNNIKDVFIIAYWKLYFENQPEPLVHDALIQTCEMLSETGVNIWLMLDVPVHDMDVPKILTRQYIVPFLGDSIKSLTIQEHLRNNAALYSFRIPSSRVNILDPSGNLLNDSKSNYLLSENGVPLYYDNNHLTKNGALLAFLPLLESFYNSDFKK